MASLNTQAAERVYDIAEGLRGQEGHILFGSPLKTTKANASAKGTKPRPSLLGSIWTAPTQTLGLSLFRETAFPQKADNLRVLGSVLLSDQHSSRRGMIRLTWADCRNLFSAFRHYEYVDANGKPTTLVDSFVSRLTAGEASGKSANGDGEQGLRLWRWGEDKQGNGNDDDSNSNGDLDKEEEKTREAAWLLISSIFARATALRITSGAEEVSESESQGVLTWFPRLEYLEICGIPHSSLLLWHRWLPDRLSCLSVKYAGIDLASLLGSKESELDNGEWVHLNLLDLSNNPEIDLRAFRSDLSSHIPHIARLSLSSCELAKVPDSLTKLYSLTWLDLSSNMITDVSDISLRLGSIVRLNLAHNQLVEISGLRRLWALELLDLTGNRIPSWEAITVLRNLPALTTLDVADNPFSQAKSGGDRLHYRAQIFSAFDHRDVELLLDGKGPSSHERREMARIPRMATATHGQAVAGTAQDAVAKARKQKVAIIEESGESGAEDGGGMPLERGGDATEETEAASSPVARSPHVLRASELQAVTMSSSRRRSRVPASMLDLPAPIYGITMKRHHGKPKRRATTLTAAARDSSSDARTPPGFYGMASPRTSNFMYSVAASVGARAPSIMTQHSTNPSIRDPERYRRRVEVMRAEAGSSWLRAFAELQAHHSSPSPTPLLQKSPQQSPPPILASRSSNSSSSSSGSDKSRSKKADQANNAPDAQLPSFLFPRRRAFRKKQLGSLPRYIDEQGLAGAGEASPEPESAAASAVEDPDVDLKPDGRPVSLGSVSAETAASAHSSSGTSKAPEESKLDEDVKAFGNALVTEYRIESPSEDQTAAPEPTAVVRTTSSIQRAVYAAPSGFIVQIQTDASAPNQAESRIPLRSITRAGTVDATENAVRIEVKTARFDSPYWTEYEFDEATRFGEFVACVERAAAENAERGLLESVFKQAECLSCHWRGYLDNERDVFDMLSAARHETAVSLRTAELRCPKCSRRYLREYYASDEKSDGAPSSPAEQLWKQPFITRRTKPAAEGGKDSSRSGKLDRVKEAERLLQRQMAFDALDRDMQMLGSGVHEGGLPFAHKTNAISLFLQLGVFEDNSERLMQWVPAGLIRQISPLIPRDPARRRPDGNARPGSAGKWGLSKMLGAAKEKELLVDADSIADKRQYAIDNDWKAGVMLSREMMAEQVVYLALSSQAFYVFAPTTEALDIARTARRADLELQPERHLGLLFSIPLTALGRIDIGPNRQYIAFHSSLLLADKGAAQWSTREMRKLVPAHISYPKLGFAQSQGAESKEPPERQQQDAAAGERRKAYSMFERGAAMSCVFMVRDRLACSDLLDSLVEIGYETRALDSGLGEGSGRLRAINHDIEWAMHHLVQQVFLRPSTFDALDGASSPHGPDDMRALADCEINESRVESLERLRGELMRTAHGRQPGAMVDAASGDDVIVDKVTYEFMRLYLCVGVVGAGGVRARTLIGSPQFLYVARERLDVWPPPAPDLRALYRKWQRYAPPTIVTSDPDAYDPEGLALKLANRSGSERSQLEAQVEGECCGISGQLAASVVDQYDCVERARPVVDLRRVTVIRRRVSAGPAEGAGRSGWEAMLRLEFDTCGAGETGWSLWFATVSSVRECVEALQAMADKAGNAGVEFCEF